MGNVLTRNICQQNSNLYQNGPANELSTREGKNKTKHKPMFQLINLFHMQTKRISS